MNPRRIAHRLSTVAFACALVLSMVLGGVGPGSPVGTASAAFGFQDCEIDDSLISAVVTSITNPTGDSCRFNPVDASYENVTATDAHVSGLSIKDSTDSYTTTQNNLAQNTRSVAMTKAKIDVINALNNNSTSSVAQTEAEETITEYYSRMQYNVIQDWNNKMLHIHYLASNTNAVGGYSSVVGRMNTVEGWSNATRTLANGSTVTAYGISFRNNEGSQAVSLDSQVSNGRSVYTWDPDTGNRSEVLTNGEYKNLLNSYDSQSTQTIDNADQMASGYYDAYSAGEINSSDLARLDPSAISAEASTSYNDTGYYSFAAIQLAAVGASGNLNVSHTVTVTDTSDGSTTTLNGTVYYTADDVDTLETNQTYNFTNLNGTAYMAVQYDDPNRSSTIQDLSTHGDEFVIEQATNTKSGEVVENTTMEKHVYETNNASALKEEIDRLQTLRDQYESQLESDGGGGWGIGTEDKALIALAAIALILVSTRN